jgi:hypothetical protein
MALRQSEQLAQKLRNTLTAQGAAEGPVQVASNPAGRMRACGVAVCLSPRNTVNDD